MESVFSMTYDLNQKKSEVYKLIDRFPEEEIYGLTSQFRRAVVSIPSNIAEGFKKRSKSDKARFMNIAQGSLEESRYYLILSRDLEYADTSQLLSLAEELSKLLESYYSSILTSEYLSSYNIFKK